VPLLPPFWQVSISKPVKIKNCSIEVPHEKWPHKVPQTQMKPTKFPPKKMTSHSSPKTELTKLPPKKWPNKVPQKMNSQSSQKRFLKAGLCVG
jgi:hypothetical protein